MTDAKRKQIQEKVEAGEARNTIRSASVTDRIGEKAIEAKDWNKAVAELDAISQG